MTTDLDHVEQHLRTELRRRAQATHTSPAAWDEILDRGADGGPRQRPSWRRPAVALLAAVTVLVVAVWAVTDRIDDDSTPPVPPARPLPDQPPAIEGTVLGAARSMSCSGDCIDAPAQLDLADPTAPQLLTDDPNRQSPDLVLRDGRRVTPDADGPGWSVVDPATGDRIPLGRDHPWSVDVLPDGRIVTYGPGDQDDDPDELRVVGTAGTTTTILPEDFRPYAVASGPGGWTAVIGDDGGCCFDEPELLLVAPAGEMRRVDIDDALDDVAWPMNSLVSLSWSSRGLVVISPAELQFVGPNPPATPRNWAVVVDPATGEEVAQLPDWWQGLAWSPDGAGLLAAQPIDDDSARLRLYWGPGLRESRDLGTVDLPFAPQRWLAPDSR